jgi:hypothetical protein
MNPSIFIDATIVGIISLIVGTIVFNLTINRKNKDKEKPFGLHIAFFATGFFLHFIVELIGLNQYICDKHCTIESQK